MKNLRLPFLIVLTIIFSGVFAQNQSKKTVEIADIWKKYLFAPQDVYGIRSAADGLHYTILDKSQASFHLLKHRYADGEVVDTLLSGKQVPEIRNLSDYHISPDQKWILLFDRSRSIYRHSSESIVYLYSTESEELIQIHESYIRLAEMSPKGNQIAYVKDNNLFVYNLKTKESYAVTKDGEKNKIINGATDWVYEEEFSFEKAFEWSPNGDYIAYYRFDEQDVPEFSMDIYGDGLYPEQDRFKYPKAGEKNAEVSIHLHNIQYQTNSPIEIEWDYEYIARINWSADGELALFALNRHQNDLRIFKTIMPSAKTREWYRETDKAYVEVDDNYRFLRDGSMLRISGKSGYFQIHHINTKGKDKQLTKGKNDVTELYGVNEEDGLIYFQAVDDKAHLRGIYRVALNGKKKENLHEKEGWNTARFSDNMHFFILKQSTSSSPSQVSLHSANGEKIRVLEDNSALQKRIAQFELGELTFMDIPTEEGHALSAYMIKPANFDSEKKYPVLMHVYGGPGSQMVKNNYDGFNYFWHQHLASKGYIIVCVDNRGTGGKGRDFQKVTYRELGKYETDDQMEAARWLGNLPYVDKNRIGIWGWSYGGYMSSLCITKGADLFKLAIAVAPVTNWRFYDSIYTERYMRTPQENPDGYDKNSPVHYADRLKGKYLLIHGTADDNVHVQNAMHMINALVDADKAFDQFLYPDKNHGIFGGNTRNHLYQMMTRYISENL